MFLEKEEEALQLLARPHQRMMGSLTGCHIPSKDLLERLLKYCLLCAMVGSAVGAILSFLSKAIGFVVKHTSALIVFVARLIFI